jgi:hypothetical protein
MDKIQRLKTYIKRLNNREDGRSLYLEYKEDIDTVVPQDAFEIFHGLIQDGFKERDILVFLDKIINVFYESLSNFRYQRPQNDNFLLDLIMENEALKRKIDDIKIVIKEPTTTIRRQKLIPMIEELMEFYPHYSKKENILFPYLEKSMKKFEGLTIMWALHDEVKREIEYALELLNTPESDDHAINVAIAEMFFGVLGLVRKEELILFPSASEVLEEKDWYSMHKQSLEYKLPFIQKDFSTAVDEDDKLEQVSADTFKSETGELTLEQIALVFGSLPVDMTFVDENNKVRFFTKPKDRIFPRSAAIIGRDVKNCHPPDSVHIVEEIVESFRKGERDTASFWIDIKDKKILIQYFAMRSSDGEYKGVLEVSQDITEIRQLEGQSRLLQWD